MTEMYKTIPTIKVIAGHQFPMSFEVVRADNKEVDLTVAGTDVKVIVTEWGFPEHNVLTLSSAEGQIVIGKQTNQFDAYFSTADTKDLNGQYHYQVVISSNDLGEFRPARGDILFYPSNQEA